MKRTTIYLEEFKINKLQDYSFKNKVSVSEIIRKAIDNFLEQKEQTTDRIEYKDIIGIAEGPEENNVSEKVEEFLKEKFSK
ncbi:MAG: ribbon-helix-helix domain-containing protein [Actinobacteria bacterium]|nr:ribbon-helix-helix domain-containing protein [Actinomycetota bacterium]MBM3712147.1 ribbon-helix-helix domain-containing protein [Actinomycetota bacterium]